MEPITFQYCSDLHLEFPENKKYILDHPIKKHASILILAGDVVPFSQIDEHKDFFDSISDLFEFTYWIPGNHEYYYSDIHQKNGTFKESIRKNITLLNNSMVDHGSVSLIFSTLWTHISSLRAGIIENRLSDFFVINRGVAKLNVEHYNLMHFESLQFLKHAIEYAQDKTTVVVTHHVPTFINYPLKYAVSPINEAFAVELKEMIQVYQPNYWIYGHSHVNTPAFSIGKTQLLTNQLGYIRYGENAHYNESAFITA